MEWRVCVPPARRSNLQPVLRTLALTAAVALAACRGDEVPAAAEPAEAPPATAPPLPEVAEPSDPHRLVVSHGSELADAALGEVESLDLALAESDRLGRMTEVDAATACDGIDLAAIAGRAPRLRTLRISGCSGPIHDLAALGSLSSLVLSELALDASAITALSQLPQLTTLSLVRVSVPQKPELDLEPLAKLSVREIVLSDLDRDSWLGHVLGLWPQTLTRATLAGSWAGHDAMTQLGKAEALEHLELRDTRVGNFSLNQIKPLARLRALVWIGDTFNDNSPLYFRDLGVTDFTCDCPRFGDGGLHTLRHCESVERLSLPRSQVTGPGLAALGKLPALRELVLHDRDLGAVGIEALRTITTLRRLELSGVAADPSFAGLGGLVQLEQLRLHYADLEDRAAVELGRLVGLRDLDLARTQISDVGLTHFAALVNLRSLILSHTRVTNRGLSSLSGLAQLRQLYLDHTDVVDAAIVHLVPLRALESLRLDHTLVTDAAIESLLQLAELQRLDVTGTVITAEGLARLDTLPKLVDLAGGPG
jgi:hypothetical protein